MTKVTTSYPVADTILESYRDTVKGDYDGYRNHVIRMFNFSHFLLPNITEDGFRKLQIATAFHDIALWTHDRVLHHLNLMANNLCVCFLHNSPRLSFCPLCKMSAKTKKFTA